MSLRTGLGASRTAAQDSPGGGLADTWFEREAAAHSAAVSELNRAIAVPVALSHDLAILGANAVDGQIEGGGVRGINAQWNYLSKATVFHSLRTSKIGFSFLASMPAVVLNQYGRVGLKSLTASDQLVFTTDQSVSPTRFVAFAYNGGAFIVPPLPAILDLGPADASVWTWRCTSDGTTVTLARCAAAGGGPALASGTISTAAGQYPTGSGAPAFIGTTAAAGQAVLAAVFSYVSPV